MDPRTPVIVGAAQLNGRDGDNEPIAMMADAARRALPSALAIDQVRVVKGVWPYSDPGTLVAERLGLSPTATGISQLGGNEVYDLINRTASDLLRGDIDAVLVCSAETMRTRRRDRRAGRKSPYLSEAEGAIPDFEFGVDTEYWEDADWKTWGLEAVNFYAMAASAVRHRMGLDPSEYLAETAELWAGASAVACSNPNAWATAAASAEEIATATDQNRMIADPFPKLMTSNINVDQAAAVVFCTAQAARSAGVDPGSWVFPLSGSGGHDPLLARTRNSFAGSPSMRIGGAHALQLAGVSLDDVRWIDLYSCFPSAVQTAQFELGIDPARQFTITGGMTFAGGPFNSYCLHALAQAVAELRVEPGTAFLTGNGGWFSKHSFCVVGSQTPASSFRYERPQDLIDAEPVRSLMGRTPDAAAIDAYTVSYGRDGEPVKAMMAVADSSGARGWATSTDPETMTSLIRSDCVSAEVSVRGDLPVLTATL
jgi:acetyl-CoA C-acetyltransferase